MFTDSSKGLLFEGSMLMYRHTGEGAGAKFLNSFSPSKRILKQPQIRTRSMERLRVNPEWI